MAVSPGWKHDPDHEGWLRYWDGDRWTDHWHPEPGDVFLAKSDRPRRGVERLKRWVLSTDNSNLIRRAAITVACCVAYFLVSMAAVVWIPGYFGISEATAILGWLLFAVFVFGVWLALNTLYHSERGRLSVFVGAVFVLAAVTFLYLPPFVWLVGSNPCGWPPAADSCPMTTWEDVARGAAQMLAWQAADTVPALSVTETLDWAPPYPTDDRGNQFAQLLVRGVTAFLLIRLVYSLIGGWWARQKALVADRPPRPPAPDRNPPAAPTATDAR